jgi:hypothetical protein
MVLKRVWGMYTHVCMYVWVYVCMYVCVCVRIYVNCSYVYIYIYAYTHTHTHTHTIPDTLRQLVQSSLLSCCILTNSLQYITHMYMVTPHPDFIGTGPKVHLKPRAPKLDLKISSIIQMNTFFIRPKRKSCYLPH